MKIRVKLLLLFLTLFASLLLAFAVFIYIYSAKTRKDQYYKQLKREAITKANLLFDAKVPAAVLQLIYKTTPNSLFEEEVAIYDTSFHLLYHDAVQIDKVKETRKMIDQIVQEKEITFDQGSLQVVGLLYEHHQKTYVITAAASDQYGLNRLQAFKYALIVSFIIIISLTIAAGYYFVSRALKPVTEIVDKVAQITATNLYNRVQVKNQKDEIGELAHTFNGMLDRLEQSFDSQKSFVSNISHELRTPLSTIIGELQLALIRERNTDEYKEIIKLSLNDAQSLAKLSNGLLDLAKASYDQNTVSMKKLRADELLMEAREAVLKISENYKVDVQFAREIEDDDDILINGNEYLLKVAFINLIENACKFSPNHLCTIEIDFNATRISLSFKDTGIGIPPEDIPNIFTAFYRGKNKDFSSGNGIGLSLSQKIISMHQGTIQLNSIVNKGSTFRIDIPHL
ncbi:HAMP domain-containing protein [Pedobacter sp. MR2016-19]|uniref:sensor histidine kinase n=1 Tax=Pedobacter sp. MR2016-19 TaxID=2780089 RepID=UPI0018761B5B|nr:ATP-binding protein [Pedobacter sp. MR2016-19]MBE5318128.1 HAMP domain-containing protein [Pedobacter sp. MR2016-19]